MPEHVRPQLLRHDVFYLLFITRFRPDLPADVLVYRPGTELIELKMAHCNPPGLLVNCIFPSILGLECHASSRQRERSTRGICQCLGSWASNIPHCSPETDGDIYTRNSHCAYVLPEREYIRIVIVPSSFVQRVLSCPMCSRCSCQDCHLLPPSARSRQR